MANEISKYWVVLNGVRINLADHESDIIIPYGEGSEQTSVATPNGFAMIVPFSIGLTENNLWTLPVEPLLSLRGGNIISKRSVAKGKGRGTIKERWSQDDYEITLSGLLMNPSNLNAYPDEEVIKLRELCEARQALFVDCPALSRFDITRIVIESYDFPFTKGENVQAYSIKALSDDVTDLLIREEL